MNLSPNSNKLYYRLQVRPAHINQDGGLVLAVAVNGGEAVPGFGRHFRVQGAVIGFAGGPGAGNPAAGIQHALQFAHIDAVVTASAASAEETAAQGAAPAHKGQDRNDDDGQAAHSAAAPLAAAAGILVPAEGSVSFGGVNINLMSKMENRNFRRRTAFVFQDAALWANQDILANVSLPLRIHFPNLSNEERGTKYVY